MAETTRKTWLRPRNDRYILVTMTKEAITGEKVALQSWLRPALTHVGANKDYEGFRAELGAVEGLLRASHLESMAMDFSLVGYEEASARQQRRRMEFSLKALKVETLRMLLGNPPFRAFSRTVASSDLLADFCGVRRLDGIRGVSKSTLERASKFFTGEQLRWMKQVLIEMCGHRDRAMDLGLVEPMESELCLVDTTCMETKIHFPVDWVLLRDVALTLLKAIKLIRKRGLLHRMPEEPEVFARQMNRLCIEMTHTRRKDEAIKARKRVLRKMKPLLRTIAGHARHHRDRLKADFLAAGFSPAQATRIIARIDAMLAKVPEVIEQAHERIIAARQVPNDRKILSVYEPDVRVIVRGKAGREVEFGNTLFVAESTQGLILDWELYRQTPPAEWRQLEHSIDRQSGFDVDCALKATCADRGFSSRKGSVMLKDQGIYDAVCPRDPKMLKQRMDEPLFRNLQRRRASTEARIATLKHRISGKLRCKGFDHRYLTVAWSVLGHNLWIVARRLCQQETVPKAA